MEPNVDNPALRFPTAKPADAVVFFASQMTFQTDVSDVHAALESGRPDLWQLGANPHSWLAG